ncbi:MAG: pilus assembly protein [Bacilli bacterium]|nr:pilus assembly protein [Bacilli bacterium]
MKNNKGQAMVEFILILPVFLIIFLAVIDYSNILYQKYQLENKMESVIELYQNNKISEAYNLIGDNLLFTVDENNNITTFTIKQNIKILSPGLNLILGQNYEISSERVIYDET